MASACTPCGGCCSGLFEPQPAMTNINESIAIVVLTFIPLPSRGANLQGNSSKKRAPADTEMLFPNFEPEPAEDLLRVLLVLGTCCWRRGILRLRLHDRCGWPSTAAQPLSTC